MKLLSLILLSTLTLELCSSASIYRLDSEINEGSKFNYDQDKWQGTGYSIYTKDGMDTGIEQWNLNKFDRKLGQIDLRIGNDTPAVHQDQGQRKGKASSSQTIEKTTSATIGPHPISTQENEKSLSVGQNLDQIRNQNLPTNVATLAGDTRIINPLLDKVNDQNDFIHQNVKNNAHIVDILGEKKLEANQSQLASNIPIGTAEQNIANSIIGGNISSAVGVVNSGEDNIVNSGTLPLLASNPNPRPFTTAGLNITTKMGNIGVPLSSDSEPMSFVGIPTPLAESRNSNQIRPGLGTVGIETRTDDIMTKEQINVTSDSTQISSLEVDKNILKVKPEIPGQIPFDIDLGLGDIETSDLHSLNQSASSGQIKLSPVSGAQNVENQNIAVGKQTPASVSSLEHVVSVPAQLHAGINMRDPINLSSDIGILGNTGSQNGGSVEGQISSEAFSNISSTSSSTSQKVTSPNVDIDVNALIQTANSKQFNLSNLALANSGNHNLEVSGLGAISNSGGQNIISHSQTEDAGQINLSSDLSASTIDAGTVDINGGGVLSQESDKSGQILSQIVAGTEITDQIGQVSVSSSAAVDGNPHSLFLNANPSSAIGQVSSKTLDFNAPIKTQDQLPNENTGGQVDITNNQDQDLHNVYTEGQVHLSEQVYSSNSSDQIGLNVNQGPITNVNTNSAGIQADQLKGQYLLVNSSSQGVNLQEQIIRKNSQATLSASGHQAVGQVDTKNKYILPNIDSQGILTSGANQGSQVQFDEQHITNSGGHVDLNAQTDSFNVNSGGQDQLLLNSGTVSQSDKNTGQSQNVLDNVNIVSQTQSQVNLSEQSVSQHNMSQVQIGQASMTEGLMANQNKVSQVDFSNSKESLDDHVNNQANQKGQVNFSNEQVNSGGQIGMNEQQGTDILLSNVNQGGQVNLSGQDLSVNSNSSSQVDISLSHLSSNVNLQGQMIHQSEQSQALSVNQNEGGQVGINTKNNLQNINGPGILSSGANQGNQVKLSGQDFFPTTVNPNSWDTSSLNLKSGGQVDFTGQVLSSSIKQNQDSQVGINLNNGQGSLTNVNHSGPIDLSTLIVGTKTGQSNLNSDDHIDQNSWSQFGGQGIHQTSSQSHSLSTNINQIQNGQIDFNSQGINPNVKPNPNPNLGDQISLVNFPNTGSGDGIQSQVDMNIKLNPVLKGHHSGSESSGQSMLNSGGHVAFSTQQFQQQQSSHSQVSQLNINQGQKIASSGSQIGMNGGQYILSTANDNQGYQVNLNGQIQNIPKPQLKKPNEELSPSLNAYSSDTYIQLTPFIEKPKKIKIPVVVKPYFAGQLLHEMSSQSSDDHPEIVVMKATPSVHPNISANVHIPNKIINYLTKLSQEGS